MPTSASILKNIFGYDTFRPLQSEVIENVLSRRDSLAVMPTGGGKSLCYQIPALLFPGLTVVVSPLIALMKDQVEQLHATGVRAVFLNSTLLPEAYTANMELIRRGEVKLLYVAPETLLTTRLFSLLDSIQVDLLTIDEAHCISEWGHDFRPEYRQLVDVRRRYPHAVCLALTATATSKVRADIKASLGFSQSNEFVASFNRPNLYIEVAPKGDSINQTTQFLERFKDQSGIIYCFSRRQVDELAADLTHRGFSVCPYHAGLEDHERRRNQEAFIRDNKQIVVATIAFGMGINKPNVRFVLHYDLPKSIEGYYQEIGRAGRDGLPAHCLLLYRNSDVAKLRYFINQKEGNERRVASDHLNAIVRFAEDITSCRRKLLLAYFGEKITVADCGYCDVCCTSSPVSPDLGEVVLPLQTLSDITIPAQKFLSCVVRTGGRFGAQHVINILRGSKDARVLKWGHDKLSTYGIGADFPEKQWIYLARQLVLMGYLNQDVEFRTLSLTDKANAALKQRSPIMGRLQDVELKAGKRETRKVEIEYNNALFALLRQKRKEMADEAGVPPYVIFSDKTLVEMASFYPQSPERLLDISGVGQVKAKQFGDAFLTVIQNYCQKKNIPEGHKQIRSKKNDTGQRHFIVGEAYNSGESLAALVKRYNVTVGTIVTHLVRFAASGKKLRSGEDLWALPSTTPDEQQVVFTAFNEYGTDILKPIFDRLAGKVSYDELKILRLLYLSQKS